MAAAPFGETLVRFTPAELAERWRVSQRTLGRWRAIGIGPAWMKLNGRVRYAEEDVQAFEKQGRRGRALEAVVRLARQRRLTP